MDGDLSCGARGPDVMCGRAARGAVAECGMRVASGAVVRWRAFNAEIAPATTDRCSRQEMAAINSTHRRLSTA